MQASFLALAAAVLLFTSCIKPEQSHGMITESKAIELGKTEFAKTGRNPDSYNVTVETDSSGRKWLVWFDKKGPYAVPGGKHVVTVEKTTGKAIFMPGE